MNSRLSSFLLCSCYASLRWMQHQQWLVLPLGVGQGSVLRTVCGRRVRIIDTQHHVRKVDDLLVGLQLRVWRTDFAHSRQVGAGSQHIEVPFPQIGHPFCGLFLVRGIANEYSCSAAHWRRRENNRNPSQIETGFDRRCRIFAIRSHSRIRKKHSQHNINSGTSRNINTGTVSSVLVQDWCISKTVL